MPDVIELAKALISCPSVTPRDAGAQDLLASALEAMGFTCHRLAFGEGEARVENLFARLGDGAPHVCYAGHTDVVPAGDDAAWTYGAFNPTVADDGRLYGRGASDMKGSVAAFVAAVEEYLAQHGKPENGSISLLITGDEEGDAVNGTVKVLEWMAANGHVPDMALVGEPTNPSSLGQEVKIGRRGSLSGVLTVQGKQGHVAYQHLADNPLPRLAKMVQALSEYVYDDGSDHFSATNLEVTSIDVGNAAGNVIPAQGVAKFNVRFNDHWNGDTLAQQIRSILNEIDDEYSIDFRCSAESFITQPGEWPDMVRDAVTDICGAQPAYTTSGGTSDARFVVNYCPVVEFGPINESIHQIDENADVQVLCDLVRIYTQILKRAF